MRSQARIPRPHRVTVVASIAAVTALIWLARQTHDAVAGAPAPAAAREVASGQRLFIKYFCYSCHGTDGQGGAGVRLKEPFLPPFATFRSYVRKPAGRMPAYRSNALSDTELEYIYAYLKSIPAPASAKSIPLLNQ